MVSLPPLSWFFLGKLPLESLPRGCFCTQPHAGQRRGRGTIQRKVRGNTMTRRPGGGRQLCQEALRRRQMGREALRPQAEPEAGSQHRGQCQGSAWVLPWVSPLAGPRRPQRGLKNQALHIQPVSPLPEAGSSSGQRRGARSVASRRESLTRPLHTHPQILGLGDRVRQDFVYLRFIFSWSRGRGFRQDIGLIVQTGRSLF